MWQIDVMNASGTVLATYTDASPGGIVGDSIQTDTDGNGDCLTAEFTMIPGLTSISGRDYVQISQEGAVTWYGYVTTGVNPDDYTEQTIQCQGAKTLLAQMLIDSFWFEGTVAADGTVDHHQIIADMASLLPSYVSSTISNNASTTSGNLAPITAVNALFGDMMDAIVSSAQDGNTYCWGVDASRTMFIKPIGTDSLDLRGLAKKIIQWQTQNVEQIVTAVKFVFSAPSTFWWDEANLALRASSNHTADYDQNASEKTLEYLYEDSSLVTTYGRHTKVIPLVLSDTWLTFQTLSDWAAGFGSVFNTSFYDVQNETGSTAAADILASISTPGTAAYATATGPLCSIGMDLNSPSSPPIIDLSALVGFKVVLDYAPSSDNLPLEWYSYYYYNSPTTADYPNQDDELAQSTIAFNQGSLRGRGWRRGTSSFLVDPATLYSNGYPIRDCARFIARIDVNGTGATTTPTFKVYEFWAILLNTALLDAVAASYVSGPGTYPSTVTVQSDYGAAPYAKVNKRDGTQVTETVQRISRLSSTSKGTQVTYTLAYDAQRQDAIFQRLVARDQAAALSGANIGSGGSLGS